MEKNIKLDLMTSTIFILSLLFYTTVVIINIPILPTIGKYIFLFLTMLIFMLLVQKKPITKTDLKLFLPYVIFNSIYIVNQSSFTDLGSVMIVVNQISYGIIIYIFYNLTWREYQLKGLSTVFYFALPILLMLVFVFPNRLNTNTIGMFAYLLSFFPLVYLINNKVTLKKIRILFVLLAVLFIIFATDTRSILLSSAFAIMTVFLWKIITSKKIIFNLYFFFIIAFNYFIVVIYPQLYKWENFYKIDALSIKFTGKPIMTGRNTIWAQLLDLISKKPWLGYGSGVVPEDFLTTSLSAHNLYLQIGLQTGLLGVLSLVLFFYFIWKLFWKNRKEVRVMIAASFFISIIVQQNFEVTLTQNQYTIGLMQWIIIAFGLNFAFRKDLKTEPK